MFFSKLHFSEYSSRRRTLSWGGEQYGGQGFVVIAARGWPKPKSSDLNQEPTEKKASWLGTWYGEFSSSWYPIRYPFSDFLIQPELKVWGSWYFCFRAKWPFANKQTNDPPVCLSISWKVQRCLLFTFQHIIKICPLSPHSNIISFLFNTSYPRPCEQQTVFGAAHYAGKLWSNIRIQGVNIP